ncbi:MAG TPA: AmmeMemoRadiSam system radical SAM enzyme [Candidatus Hydrogenedentes bacterium]|nr:AmmeMemoRadiSam system radical SAM enzyme [Candidatus Hydrogenedentota bacterium]
MSKTIRLRELLEDNTIPAAPELAREEVDGRGGRAVRCLACGHRCLIREGRAGVCRVRFVRDGALRAPGGYVAGLQIDPIEKKPFYHAFPGRDALSFGMLGCDLHCAYCQNWVSSQVLRDDEAVAMPHFCGAGELVDLALRHSVPVVVSTYNEPLITADWAAAVFERARERGLVCGFVSNGNATPEVIEFLRPFVTLYKVDLKSFSDRNYRQLGCTLANVLETIERLKAMDFWVEIVTLIVPGFNDSDDEIRRIAEFIAGVSPDIPWHITAFHPDYKMTGPRRTSAQDLDRAWRAGRAAGLRFVYPGNLPGQVGERENTCCPQCGTTLIERHGFFVVQNCMDGAHCPDCRTALPGVWEPVPPQTSNGSGAPRAVWF